MEWPEVTAGSPEIEDEHASLLNNVVPGLRWWECGGTSRRWKHTLSGAVPNRCGTEDRQVREVVVKGGPADGLEPCTSVPTGPGERLMAVIGKQMEPNRLSIRLFGDVRSTTPK